MRQVLAANQPLWASSVIIFQPPKQRVAVTPLSIAVTSFPSLLVAIDPIASQSSSSSLIPLCLCCHTSSCSILSNPNSIAVVPSRTTNTVFLAFIYNPHLFATPCIIALCPPRLQIWPRSDPLPMIVSNLHLLRHPRSLMRRIVTGGTL